MLCKELLPFSRGVAANRGAAPGEQAAGSALLDQQHLSLVPKLDQKLFIGKVIKIDLYADFIRCSRSESRPDVAGNDHK
jgi:hypothetical protein